MATRISNVAALAACDAVVDLVDGGAGAGYIQIRTGAAPTNCEDANTGTLLATLTMSDPAFGAAADLNPGARATAAAITSDTSADATGTAGHGRVFDSNNVCIMQGAAAAGSGEFNFNSVAIQSGAEVAITSMTYTQPET